MNSDLSALKLTEDPISSFLGWLDEAQKASLPEPTAMTLATATKEGVPRARVVLFKGISTGSSGRAGLQFFTNYTSPKSHELEERPQAALVFFWAPLARQVRFEGHVERLTPDESNAYFQSRPRGSQIGAWSSPQSQKISSRAELLRLVAENEKKFSNALVPCPPFWGGWRLVPERVEFWQAGDSRLHDRFLYEWDGSKWQISRLAP